MLGPGYRGGFQRFFPDSSSELPSDTKLLRKEFPEKLFIIILVDVAPLKPPGKTDLSKELHVKFVISELSGTGDSQRDSRESIRANHSQLKPLFL